MALSADWEDAAAAWGGRRARPAIESGGARRPERQQWLRGACRRRGKVLSFASFALLSRPRPRGESTAWQRVVVTGGRCAKKREGRLDEPGGLRTSFVGRERAALCVLRVEEIARARTERPERTALERRAHGGGVGVGVVDHGDLDRRQSGVRLVAISKQTRLVKDNSRERSKFIWETNQESCDLVSEIFRPCFCAHQSAPITSERLSLKNAGSLPSK
jgi:hypothetical protein